MTSWLGILLTKTNISGIVFTSSTKNKKKKEIAHMETITPQEDVQALQQLRQEANGYDDHETLDDMQEALGVSLKEGLGRSAVEDLTLVQLDTGEIVAQDFVDREHAAGRNVTNIERRS
jgi:hypothetical protein